MPILHPALAEFQTELERLGFVVVCHGDYICVRLPLVASVRVHLNGGQLHFEPRFGPLSRGSSLVVTPMLALLAVAGVVAVASLPVMILAAFAGSLTVLYDIARLVLTEGAMTRLQLLWSTRPPPRDIAEAPARGSVMPGRGGAPALPDGAPAVGERGSVRVEGDAVRAGH
jgi:hypothetical protein